MAAMAGTAQSTGAYFLSSPCLTPDGQAVVFSFEGDLWKAALNNGQAVRLTAMQGYENNAKISPDGKWIAFTGRQMGNADVYVMPLAGGEIKQLTFHSAGDEMNSWSWDSKKIYFTSNRTGQISGYTVGSLEARRNGCSATIIFCLTMASLNILPAAKCFLMIHGKAATR
jgi:tricorn protease